jgi:hypothetical protein
MTEPEKPDLTKSVVGRMIDAEKAEIRQELAKIRAEQERRDAEQDAKIPRPSVAVKAAKAADISLRYPIPFSVAGLAFIAGGVAYFEGAKMWTLVGVGVCLVPGLASRAIEFVGGLKKAKE